MSAQLAQRIGELASNNDEAFAMYVYQKAPDMFRLLMRMIRNGSPEWLVKKVFSDSGCTNEQIELFTGAYRHMVKQSQSA